MQDLIDKLKKNNGLNDEQAKGVLNTITEYIKDKFPMFAGAVDSLFDSSSNGDDPLDQPGSDAAIADSIKGAEQGKTDKESGFYEGLSPEEK
jgi:hypothetical protein